MPGVIADVDNVPSLDLIEDEVLSGLKADGTRMDWARTADNYYLGRSEQYIEPRLGETDEQFAARPKRTTKVVRSVARLLSGQLWARRPQREAEGMAEVSAWYQNVLATSQADVRLVAADRAAIVADVAALEIEGTGEGTGDDGKGRPIKLYLWKAHEFAAWARDDDPCDVWAVCTRSLVRVGGGKVRARLRLWSALERRTYYSAPYAEGEAAAGKQVWLEPSESEHPYPGVLPFTFVRFEPAVSEFWEPGPGESLVACNGEADRELSDIAQHVQEFLNPTRWARNLAANARVKAQPDGVVHLVAPPETKVGDMKAPPELGLLQASLAAAEAWEDLNNYVDRTLEDLGIPAEVLRTTSQPSDLSGVAITAKKIPFYDQARERQVYANEIETDLFARCCAVAGTLHNHAGLLAAAMDPKLVVTWPEPKIPLPTAERDTADQWEMDQGLSDPIEVLARRRGLTLKQAEELAEQIAERRTAWASLMAGANQAEMDAEATPPDDPAGPDQEQGNSQA